jgi:hypothetical protein
MALTVYAFESAAAGSGSQYSTTAGSDLTIIGPSLNTGPPTGTSIYGFVDGEQKAHYFYSSQANTIALPTLVAPNIVNTNFVQLGGASSVIYGLSQTGADYGTGGTIPTGIGAVLVCLSFAAGSPDAASPGQFYLDIYGLLLTTSGVYYWG